LAMWDTGWQANAQVLTVSNVIAGLWIAGNK
jgi:hypothetical protein